MNLNEPMGPGGPAEAASSPASPSPSTLSPPPRRTIAPVVVAVLAVLLVASSVGATAAYFELRPHPSSPATSSGVWAIDDAGRNVSLSSPAHRLVVLMPSVMDIVYRLGLRSDVIGWDCGTPAVGGVEADYTPQQVQLWNLSSSSDCITWIPSLDLQSIVALHPDLVLAGVGISLADLETLSSTDGIPSAYLSPTTLLGIGYDVQVVGDLTGKAQAAQQLVAQMVQSLDQVPQVFASHNDTHYPRVLLTYYVDTTGYYTFGPGSFGNDLLGIAQAVSITSNDSYANQGEISGSYVMAADPGVIVVGTGFGLNVSSYAIAPAWSSLPAVQQGHVYGLDATLISEPDPTMVFGLSQLVSLLHPELNGGQPL